MFNEDPTFETDAAPQEYSDKVLSLNNWGWGEKPSSGLLPPTQNGKAPRIVCVEEDCPPEGPSFDKNLAVQAESRRSLHPRLNRNWPTHNHAATIAAIKKRQVVHADCLIISKLAEHSATSLGPDMVSWAEQMFCDMLTKTLWPVCADNTASRCFDMDTESVRGSGNELPTVEQPPYTNGTNVTVYLAASSKSYTSVSTWDS